MTLWLVFALMTAAAIFAVLWPLARRSGVHAGGSDLAVYRDQLDEVTRDRASGLIGAAEAEAAKIEISRRLIAAADATDNKPPESGDSLLRRRFTAVAALVLVPIGAVALYLALGSPQLPGEPLQARLNAIHNDRSIASLVAQVEQHLAKNPGDARGYEVLAPVYLQLGRFQDAINARRKILALAGETAERQADLGEALTAAANGVVTAEAKSAFERALTLDGNQPKAQFFIGVAAEQDGDRGKAAAIWQDMLKKAPAGAPWIATVQQALAQIGAQAGAPAAANTPGPSAADMAAAAQMSEGDRSAMVHTMVARLADRLKQNGDDVEGWQRLLRAYVVLNERDKAQAAAGDARKALASDPEKLRRIEDVIKSLGLES
ncbi:MAG TPA: c-type cytochrome biogenesis protein CcmI [Pseudolabrys sp.]|nr:c-type cytochrome biogenesis protein CcmI [Pseudolabrys sp.]